MAAPWKELPGGGVRKQLLSQGHGDPIGPSPNGPVCVHYTGRLDGPDGECFDTSVGGEPFVFHIGGGEVIEGCDAAVASMRVGERAAFLIEPHRGYGSEGSEPDVPPNATLHFVVELLRVGEAPRVLLAHDSDEAFALDAGRLPRAAAAAHFDDGDGDGDGDGGGGGMFDDAPDDDTAGTFADADEEEADGVASGGAAAAAAAAGAAPMAARAGTKQAGPLSVFDQLGGGGGGNDDDNDLGEERNGVVTFNIPRGGDLLEPKRPPDVASADAFPSLGGAAEPPKPVWPRAAPAPAPSKAQAHAGAAAASAAAVASGAASATTSGAASAGARRDAAAAAGPASTAAGPPSPIARVDLGQGGADGSPFPDRPDDADDDGGGADADADADADAVAVGGKGDGVGDDDDDDKDRPPSDVLVVDTAGFLRDAPLHRLGHEIYTIPEVISEIRDRAVRERMAGVLPYELKFREPHPRSVAAVAEFARETGDFHGLSAVDLKVLALTHTLTVERNGEAGINTKPVISIRDAPKSTSRHGWFVPPAESSGSSSSSGGGSSSVGADAVERGDESSNATADTLPTQEQGQDPAGSGGPGGALKSVAAAEAAWGGDWSADKPEDERGWITPGNREAVVRTLGRRENCVRAAVRVGCVTADFSMQNVLLQMGMHVVGVDGLLIRRVKTFSLRCEACFRITHEVHRRFCRGCGHPTLHKITVTTDAEGRVEYRMPRRVRTSNRGARYTAPAPKMGRVNNIIVREDQRELTRPLRREKAFDAYTADIVAGESPFKHTDRSVNAKKGGKIGPNMGKVVIGGGRDPNAVRKRTGNKKKK